MGIAGHEGAGVVVALGSDVEATGQWKVGDRAGIKWIAEVCGHCEVSPDLHTNIRETFAALLYD